MAETTDRWSGYRNAVSRAVFIAALLMTRTSYCQTEASQDEGIRILQNVSKEWARNQLKIKTWEGAVRIHNVTTSRKSNAVSDAFYDFEFSYERSSDRLLHRGTIVRYQQETPDKPKEFSDVFSGFRGGLRTGDGYTKVFHSNKNKNENKRVATLLRPRSSARPGWLNSEDFDPLFYTYHNESPIDLYIAYEIKSWEFDRGVGFSVKQEDDVVRFQHQFDHVQEGIDFSLNQGKNLLRYSYNEAGKSVLKLRIKIHSRTWMACGFPRLRSTSARIRRTSE